MRIKYFVIVLIAFIGIVLQCNEAFARQPYRYHTVRQGETVFSISRQYEISTEDIYDLNPQARNGIKPQEILRLPDDNNSTHYILHTVLPKETLYSLSKKYNIGIEDILAANDGLNSTNFKAGSVIRIPKSPIKTVNVKNESDPAATTHRVLSGETLYSISRIYNVTIDQITDLNPEIKTNGLKKDMLLIIPNNRNTSQPAINISPETNLLSQMVANNAGVIKIGLLLPFIDIQQNQKARFVEYYEGFLLAVEDMKKRRYSIDLYAFDIRKGNNTKKLESLLETAEMKSLDMIIGGVTEQEIRIISEFTKEYGIEYAIPFPVRSESTVTNPDAFHSNVSPSILYPKIAEIFTNKFGDCNIIILENGSANDNDKQDYVNILKKRLSSLGIPNQTLSIDNALSNNLQVAFSSSKKNIIVPASSSLMTLGKIIPAIRSNVNDESFFDVSLFGYPDWQTYTVQYLDDFFKYDTYIFSSFFVDNNDFRTRQFTERFQKWYGKSMINSYPKYGILGYDTGLYFITALAKGQGKMKGNIPASDVPSLQSAFYFNMYNNIGNINTGLYFIHYTKNLTIEKIDYSK